MKMKNYFFLSLVCMFLFSGLVFANLTPKQGLKAYLKIAFENSKMFPDSLAQNLVKAGIEDIFKKEGVNIVEVEKPDIYEEYKLYINIGIKDSLIISAKGITWDMGTTIMKYPRSSSAYGNKSDIYTAVEEYIIKYITGKAKFKN